jgi:hypothetical protein
MSISAPPETGSEFAAPDGAAERGGGRLTALLSLAAFVFSGISFYTSVLQQADLDVFVPPVIQYARDAGGEIDVLAIPITIANGGGNTGTVLAMELVVAPAAREGDVVSKTFYSAFVGEHPRNAEATVKTFAPISVPARASYSETIRFYPQGNPLPKIVTESGEYRFTLKLMVATTPEPSLIDRFFAVQAPPPLVFTRTLPYISEQHLGFRRGTISMHAKDWQPTTSAAR